MILTSFCVNCFFLLSLYRIECFYKIIDMKKFIMLFISIAICNYGFSQFEIGLLPKIGYNVVDIEKSTNLSKYGNTTSGYYLNDWDQLNYGGTLYGLFKKDRKVNFGGEITFNRLYYWEEAYETYGAISAQLDLECWLSMLFLRYSILNRSSAWNIILTVQG